LDRHRWITAGSAPRWISALDRHRARSAPRWIGALDRHRWIGALDRHRRWIAAA
jgi:hypothetical protein